MEPSGRYKWKRSQLAAGCTRRLLDDIAGVLEAKSTCELVGGYEDTEASGVSTEVGFVTDEQEARRTGALSYLNVKPAERRQ
jgi:hypothetical protein